MSNAFGDTANLGSVASIPTGPRGRGIRRVNFEDGYLVLAMSDGTTEHVKFPLPTSPPTDGAQPTPDGTDTTTVTPAVIAYVTDVTTPLASKNDVTKLLGDYATVAAFTSGLAGKADLKHTHTTADITDLSTSLATYLRQADAATLYAAKTHTHLTSDVNGLEARLAQMDDAIATATGVDMSSYATDAEVATAIRDLNMTAYLKAADASNLYAPTAHTHAIADVTGLQSALDGLQATLPTGTDGQVLTRVNGAWAAADVKTPSTDLSAYSTTAQADAKYAAKSHTHPVSERFTMQGPLAVKASGARAYNTSGAALTVTSLHLAVDTPPTGSGVTVALKKNGTQIATATIAPGANTAQASDINSAWSTTDYLTVDVTAVGSTTTGADLVVTVRAS